MDTEQLTEERGKQYGSPLKHFHCTQSMYDEWLMARGLSVADELPQDIEHGIKHSVYLILDKLARASEDPTHLDNWKDIQGYAACALGILEGEE